ncbi:hypothetical protein ACU4GD_16580 [Cupriavidus basilensis]
MQQPRFAHALVARPGGRTGRTADAAPAARRAAYRGRAGVAGGSPRGAGAREPKAWPRN